MKPLRIAHITPGLDVGGLEKLLAEFARHSDDSRCEPVFISLTDAGPIASEIRAAGRHVEAMGKPPGLRPGLVLRLARVLRRLRIDVVHTHDNGPLIYGAAAARLARLRGVVHSRHQQNAHATPRETRAFRHATRLVDFVAGVSDDSVALCRREGVSPGKIRLVLNGVDTDRFEYLGPADGGPAVAVARLSREKGVDWLLRAAAIASREDPAFRLLVAGDGPCREELAGMMDELGLREVVTLLGSVDDVPALLARAGVFVLPSLTEGIAVTLLEAMGRGLPVVATRVGGTPEVVDDGETGLLVPPADPEALARRMLGVLRDPELARQMGMRGRRLVEERFDVRRMVGAYEDLYERAATGRPGRVAVDRPGATPAPGAVARP